MSSVDRTPPVLPVPAEDQGLAEATRSLSLLGTNLIESYNALERRAEHVEEELCRTNEALERKVAELDAVTGDLEAILEALPTGVVVRGEGGRIQRINRAATEILGAERADLLGREDHPAAPGLGQVQGTARDWNLGEHVRTDGRRIDDRVGGVQVKP